MGAGGRVVGSGGVCGGGSRLASYPHHSRLCDQFINAVDDCVHRICSQSSLHKSFNIYLCTCSCVVAPGISCLLHSLYLYYRDTCCSIFRDQFYRFLSAQKKQRSGGATFNMVSYMSWPMHTCSVGGCHSHS